MKDKTILFAAVGGEEFDDEVLGKLREALKQQTAHLPPEQRAAAFAALERLGGSIKGLSVLEASASSICQTLEGIVSELDSASDALMPIARSIDHQKSRGPAVFMLGVAQGNITGAMGLLKVAVQDIEKAMSVTREMREAEQGKKEAPSSAEPS